MTDVVVDRLRIRGADGRRLAAVAARSLPAALEQALSDLADVRLGSLSVTLDVDLADHDDVTLAVLWADRIRAAALAAGAHPRADRAAAPAAGAHRRAADAPGPDDVDVGAEPDASVSRVGGRARDDPARADPDALVAVAISWLAARAAPATVPVALAALAEPARTAAVLARLGAARGTELARALELAAHRHPAGSAGRAGPADHPDEVARLPDGDLPAGGHLGTGDRTPQPAGPGLGEPAEPARRVTAAAQAVRPLLDLAARAAGPASTADLTLSTRVAGLVLLHPWLADLCRVACEAEAWHRVRDPADVRRIALAALVDPQDPDLADDPLVLFLAGAGPAAASSATLAPLAARTLVVESAEGLLTRFAALLPGFERSSPGFVRTAWLVRAGLLATDRDPAQLLAETAPLDVVLPLLPYPTGLLRLPWTPPLIVRFVP